MLGHTVHSRLGICPRRQRNDARICHSQVRASVKPELSIHDTPQVLGHHGASAGEVVGAHCGLTQVLFCLFEARVRGKGAG